MVWFPVGLVIGQILRRFARLVKGDRRPASGGLIPAGRRGITARMKIYKIFREAEWESFKAAGETLGAPVDLADGFVHFSTAGQVAETAAKHFAGEGRLVLLALEADALGEALKWEVSRGGARFPHLYRVLRLDDVLWTRPLPLVGGRHRFPEDMA
jgi:uncharacterized protein (DUF952 family)